MAPNPDAAVAESRGRLLVLGAGAVGASLGGLLARGGREVVLIARGAQLAALRRDGLQLRLPGACHKLRLPVFARIEELAWQPDDTVLLAVKSQDTAAALADVDRRSRLVCAQNGVCNEPAAAALGFAQVYGMMVWTPALCLDPGCVDVFADPPGVLRLGRHPEGEDAFCRGLTRDLAEAGYDAGAVADIMHVKRSKLLCNLGNGLDAWCVPGPGVRALARRVSEEGARVLRAAGLSFAADFAQQMNGRLAYKDVAGRSRAGGSTWQSVMRGRSSEVAFLNGTICALGAQAGVSTPLNAMLCGLAERAPAARSVPLEQLLQEVPAPALDKQEPQASGS